MANMHSQNASQTITVSTTIIKLEKNFHIYWKLIFRTAKIASFLITALLLYYFQNLLMMSGLQVRKPEIRKR